MPDRRRHDPTGKAPPLFSRSHKRRRRVVTAPGLLVLAAALLVPAGLRAQQGSVTGTVTAAADARPLSGVQVTIEGTQIGALTDQQGHYRLTSVPAGSHRIRARLIGYQSKAATVSVPAGGSATADFTLGVSAVTMEELVVTETGLRRRREVGHAVTTLDVSHEAEMSQPQNVQGLIQSRASSVTIQKSSGSVGTSQNFKIRGITSLSFSNRPLVYVDGARISTATPGSGQQGQSYSLLNNLDPNDIASIEVIKGPAAATLYGTEAAAGVIRITTKRGQTGRASYNFNAQYGQNWNSTDWLPRVWHPRSILGAAARDTLYTYNGLEGPGDPFRTGDVYSLGGNVRGGEKSINYFVSTHWDNEKGVFPTNSVKQWHVRGNFGIHPDSSILSLTVSNGFTSSFTRLPGNDNNINAYLPIALVSFPWTQPLTRDGVRTCPLNIEVSQLTGQSLSDLGFAGCADSPNFGGRTFSDISEITRSGDVERYVGSGTLTLQPWDSWTTRLTVGYDQYSQRVREIIPVDPSRPFGSSSDGFISRQDITGRHLTLDLSSSLRFDLTPSLGSETTFGGQWIRDTNEGTTSLGRQFPPGTPSVGSSVINEGGDLFSETKTLGGYIQEQIRWNDRLFITPGIRFDDNSAFGQNLGVQTLKKISGSWVLSEEPWFPQIFNSLRLRVAWGESSKLPGTNSALALLTPVPAVLNGQEVLGALPSQPGNADLKPEKSSEFEAGFDLSAVQDRVGLEFSYYHNTTHDAVVAQDLAPSIGYPNPRFANVGAITNHGIETSLDLLAVDRSNLRWNWTVVFSTNHNRVTELPAPILINFGNDSNAGQQIREGYPFGAYMWLPVTMGANGQVAVGDTLEMIGQPTPTWQGSVSTSLRLFDHFEVYGLLGFEGGASTDYNTASFTCNLLGGGAYGGTCPDLFQSHPDGSKTDLARVEQVAAGIGNEAPWIESAAFAKLRTLSLRYDFPDKLARMLGARSGSLTISGENLATFAGFTGPDPEVNEIGGDATVGRSVFLTEPQERRFITRISLSF